MNYSLLTKGERISYFSKAFLHYREEALTNPKLISEIDRNPIDNVTVLKYIRLSFGLSAVELATLIGCSPRDQAIVKVENLIRKLSPQIERRITEELVLPDNIFQCTSRAEIDLALHNWYVKLR